MIGYGADNSTLMVALDTLPVYVHVNGSVLIACGVFSEAMRCVDHYITVKINGCP